MYLAPVGICVCYPDLGMYIPEGWIPNDLVSTLRDQEACQQREYFGLLPKIFHHLKS